MGKAFVFEVNEENGSATRKVFLNKPSVEELLEVCCHYENQDELKNALEKVLQYGSASFDNESVELELSSIDFVDNQGIQRFKGEGVRLITQFRFDDEVVAMPYIAFETFMFKLSSEDCEIFLKDEENEFNFNHLEVKSFLQFYERLKKGEVFGEFDENERAMIERVRRLIEEEKPSYVKNSGYVRFI